MIELTRSRIWQDGIGSNEYQFSKMKRPGYKSGKEQCGGVWCNRGEHSYRVRCIRIQYERCTVYGSYNVGLEAVFCVMEAGVRQMIQSSGVYPKKITFGAHLYIYGL